VKSGVNPVLSRNCDENPFLSQVIHQTDVLYTSWSGSKNVRKILSFDENSLQTTGSLFFYTKRIFSMHKQKITPVLLFLVFTLLLGACGAQTAAPEMVEPGIVLTDDLGREVTLDAPAASIVSIAPSNTEILYAIGAGDLLVGRDEFSYYPEEALDITSIGGGFEDYNLETITSLNPDLVLAAEINAPEVIDALEKLDIPVYYLGNPDDFAGLYANIKTVGILSGHENEAKTLAESLQTRVESLLKLIAEDENIPTVFFELDASEPAKPWTTGGGTFVNYLISMAGAKNIAADVKDEWVQYSQEELIVQNPDIIILADAKWGTTADMVKERPGWDVLSAVQNNAIYPIDDDLTSRPGPRLVDGLEAMVKICHPELEIND
jgi:iron complex transport system substrate-binding protein